MRHHIRRRAKLQDLELEEKEPHRSNPEVIIIAQQCMINLQALVHH
jgi:hypothetical protein